MPNKMPKQNQQGNGQGNTPDISNQLGQLGQLRDILFGEDKREFEAHFSSIEQSLSSQIEQLTLYVNQELKSLREESDKQFQLLNNQLLDSDHAHNERQDHIQAFVDSTAERLSAFEQKTQQTTEQIKESAAQATQQLEMQLTNDIAKLSKELGEELVHVSQTLSHDKADRTALADILSAAAAQLTALDNACESNATDELAVDSDKDQLATKSRQPKTS